MRQQRKPNSWGCQEREMNVAGSRVCTGWWRSRKLLRAYAVCIIAQSATSSEDNAIRTLLLHRAASLPGTAEISGRSGGDALSQSRHQLMEQIEGLVVFFFFFFNFFCNMIDLNLLNYSLARWKCSCTILLSACESNQIPKCCRILFNEGMKIFFFFLSTFNPAQLAATYFQKDLNARTCESRFWCSAVPRLWQLELTYPGSHHLGWVLGFGHGCLVFT